MATHREMRVKCEKWHPAYGVDARIFRCHDCPACHLESAAGTLATLVNDRLDIACLNGDGEDDPNSACTPSDLCAMCFVTSEGA